MNLILIEPLEDTVMRRLTFVGIIALVPFSAFAQCPTGDVAKSGVQLTAVQTASDRTLSVKERNDARLRAALGEDDSHATDADDE